MFKDRIEAGQKLGHELAKVLDPIEKGIVLGLPRGGVVTAFEVAKILDLPMDIIVTRKIGSALNSEYAIGAVSQNTLVLNENEPIDNHYLKEQVLKERQEISRRLNKYRGERRPLDLKDKTVILVDDGLATGFTMQAAVKEVRIQRPYRIIVAIPIAPADIVHNLNNLVDEMIILKKEPLFFAVGQFYETFEQVNNDEVVELLKKSWQSR